MLISIIGIIDTLFRIFRRGFGDVGSKRVWMATETLFCLLAFYIRFVPKFALAMSIINVIMDTTACFIMLTSCFSIIQHVL